MRGRGLASALFVAIALLIACHRIQSTAREAPAKSQPRVVPSPAVIASGDRVQAFELAALGSGALLAWARPRADAEEIVWQELDAVGAARGPARRAAMTAQGAKVDELAMAVTDSRRVGLIWVESSARAARTLGFLATLDGTPPAPSELATPVRAAGPVRGRIAASSMGMRVRAFYEIGPSPCVDGSTGPCTGYGFRELESGPLARQSPWLSVPAVCGEGAVGLSMLEDRFFYSLCTQSEEGRSITAFSINLEPQYARSDQVLEGCAVLGMTAIDAATVLLAGDCAGARRAARLTADGSEATEISLAEVRLECDGDHATIRGADWGLPLRASHDRLEAILPAELMTRGARAVFTGTAVLIARAPAKGLELQRLTCESGSLVREPHTP